MEKENQSYKDQQSNFSNEMFSLIGCIQNQKVSDSQAKELSKIFNLKSQNEMINKLTDITKELIDIFGLEDNAQIKGLLDLLIEFANKWGDRGVEGLEAFIKVFRFQSIISNNIDPLLKALVSHIKHDLHLPEGSSIYETFTYNYINLN